MEHVRVGKSVAIGFPDHIYGESDIFSMNPFFNEALQQGIWTRFCKIFRKSVSCMQPCSDIEDDGTLENP